MGLMQRYVVLLWAVEAAVSQCTRRSSERLCAHLNSLHFCPVPPMMVRVVPVLVRMILQAIIAELRESWTEGLELSMVMVAGVWMS